LFLTAADVENITYKVAAQSYPDYPDPMPAFHYLGGDHGRGLLESALAQPGQTFDGRYLYRTIFDKAAVLLCSIIKNHPLVDGNKRTGLTTVGVFLMLNGYFLDAPTDEAVQRCIAIASTEGSVDVREVARWIRSRATGVDTVIRLGRQLAQQRPPDAPDLAREFSLKAQLVRQRLRRVRSMTRQAQQLRQESARQREFQ
jgi:death-on-curing protein